VISARLSYFRLSLTGLAVLSQAAATLHLVAAGMPNLENVQIRLIGTVDVAAVASKLDHWGSNLVEL